MAPNIGTPDMTVTANASLVVYFSAAQHCLPLQAICDVPYDFSERLFGLIYCQSTLPAEMTLCFQLMRIWGGVNEMACRIDNNYYNGRWGFFTVVGRRFCSCEPGSGSVIESAGRRSWHFD